MATTKVSYEMVAEAAEKLLEQGSSATVRAVTTMVGGSANTITRFLNQWKSARPAVRVEEFAVDPRIGQIVAEQIKTAVGAARGEIERRLHDTEADLSEVAKAGTEAEDRAESLAAEVQSLKERNHELNGRIRQLEGDADNLKAEAASAILSAEERVSAETKMRETAQVELAKAQLRLESLPRLESEIADLRKSLETEHGKRTDAERTQAKAEATASGLTDRLADAQQQVQRAISAQQITESELAEVRKSLASKIESMGTQAGTIAALKQQLSEFEKKLATVTGKKVGRPKKDAPGDEVRQGE